MHKLLHSSRNNIVKEAAWTISNITAGNPHQIAAVIEEGLFEDVCEVLKGGEYRSQKEAAWVITNVTSSGTEAQISYLIGTVGILKPFCDLMTSQDPRCVLVILSGIKNLLVMADKKGFLENFLTVNHSSIYHSWSNSNGIFRFVLVPFQLFEQIGGTEKLERLQEHENEEVYKQVYTLLETYFAEVSSYHFRLNFQIERPIFSRIESKYHFFVGLQSNEAENLAPKADGEALEFSTNNAATNGGFKF